MLETYLVYIICQICTTCLMAALIVKRVDDYDVFRQVSIDDNGEWKYGEIGGFSFIIGAIWPISWAWVILWHLMDTIGRWAVRRAGRAE